MARIDNPLGVQPAPDNPVTATTPPGSTRPQGAPVSPTEPPLSDNVVTTNPPAGRVNLDAMKSLPDPGAVLKGTTNTNVVTPEGQGQVTGSSDPKRNFDEEIQNLERQRDSRDSLADFAHTPPDAHPPLREGDKIQGPHDRANRPPTDAELEHGRVAQAHIMAPELVAKPHEPKDPPIEKNAPPDRPADPRQVAASRGMIGEPPKRSFSPAEPRVDTTQSSEALMLTNEA